MGNSRTRADIQRQGRYDSCEGKHEEIRELFHSLFHHVYRFARLHTLCPERDFIEVVDSGTFFHRDSR
jgi:hypothetical protein